MATPPQVAVDDVLYFHADEKYTVVQTAQAELLIRTPICELLGQLDANHLASPPINHCQHAPRRSTRRDEPSRLFVRIRGQVRELPVSRAYVHLFKAM